MGREMSSLWPRLQIYAFSMERFTDELQLLKNPLNWGGKHSYIILR